MLAYFQPDKGGMKLDNDEKFGLLVVGHGSSLPYNRQLITDVADMLSRKMPGAVTRIGFMNINKPTIKDGLDSFKGTGVKRIVVFPLFLARGVHTTEDVPGLIGLGEGQRRIAYDGFDIVYADPLGADDLLAELSAKRIREAYGNYSDN
jgi:sirohydrochlorin ferrochelatase